MVDFVKQSKDVGFSHEAKKDRHLKGKRVQEVGEEKERNGKQAEP